MRTANGPVTAGALPASGQVSIKNIEQQLNDLWKQLASEKHDGDEDQTAVMRATALTLIVYTSDQRTAERVGEVVGQREDRLVLPGRVGRDAGRAAGRRRPRDLLDQST